MVDPIPGGLPTRPTDRSVAILGQNPWDTIVFIIVSRILCIYPAPTGTEAS